MTEHCIVRIAAPSEQWLRSRRGISQFVTDVIEHAVQGSRKVHSLSEVSLVLSDDRELRLLNNEHRGIDKPTNVLAFPGEPLEEEGDQSTYTLRDKPLMLGDIVVAFETVEREAAEQGKTFDDHLTHLLVHGVLHLCGFDHDKAADAERMENLERDILAKMNIKDPYAELLAEPMELPAPEISLVNTAKVAAKESAPAPKKAAKPKRQGPTRARPAAKSAKAKPGAKKAAKPAAKKATKPAAKRATKKKAAAPRRAAKPAPRSTRGKTKARKPAPRRVPARKPAASARRKAKR